MKFGGQSWNGSYNHKPGVRTNFVCSSCGRKYKTIYNRDVHQRICIEHWGEE